MKSFTAYSLCAFLLAAVPSALAETKEAAVPVRTVAPHYPEDMLRAGVSGVVTVRCTIDAQGNVTDAQVVKYSLAIFQQPALEALHRWKFKPGKLDGVAVATKALIPVQFVANE